MRCIVQTKNSVEDIVKSVFINYALLFLILDIYLFFFHFETISLCSRLELAFILLLSLYAYCKYIDNKIIMMIIITTIIIIMIMMIMIVMMIMISL